MTRTKAAEYCFALNLCIAATNFGLGKPILASFSAIIAGIMWKAWYDKYKEKSVCYWTY